MAATPLIIERIYNAPVTIVWHALTNREAMKQWYFNIDDFKPEVGFEFHFYGGSEEKQYKHLCRITQVVPEQKIAYTWRYENYPGDSEVTFELFPEGNDTRVRLTHTGLETFPKDSKDFAVSSFTAGWTEIIGTLLKNFVEKK